MSTEELSETVVPKLHALASITKVVKIGCSNNTFHIIVHGHQSQVPGKSLGAREGRHERMGYIVQWQWTHWLTGLLPRPLYQVVQFGVIYCMSSILFPSKICMPRIKILGNTITERLKLEGTSGGHLVQQPP